MGITMKQLLEATKLTDDQKKRYLQRKDEAEKCLKNAEIREAKNNTDFVRPRPRGSEYHDIDLLVTSETDYWNGFLCGLHERMQFRLDSKRAANDFRDIPITESFRGFLAGYMLYELGKEAQKEYGPHVVPPDCPPIVY
jgi:hypothetical protein